MAHALASRKSKFFIVTVALAVSLTAFAVIAQLTAYSQSNIVSPTMNGELSGIKKAAQEINITVPPLRNGRFERYIDRVELPDYARNLYHWLEESTDFDGVDDWLIDDYFFTPTTGYMSGNFSQPGTLIPIWGGYAVSLGPVDTAEPDELHPYIRSALEAFDRDHPEVFWLTGTYPSSILPSADGSNCAVIWIYGDGTDARLDSYRSESSIVEAICARDAQVAKLSSAAKEAGCSSAEDMVRFFDRWLTTNNEYNTGDGRNRDANDEAYSCMSALVGKVGDDGPVCEGYSRALKVLCDANGIPCVLTDGLSYQNGESGSHMWNLVKIRSDWYAVDVTWDDVAQGSGANSGYETDDYVLVGSETVIEDAPFCESHQTENTVYSDGIPYLNEPQLADEACATSFSWFSWFFNF